MADIPKLSRLINGVSRNVDLSANTLVVDNLKAKLGGANHFTFSGTLSAARTITMPDADVNLGHIAALVSLSGVSGGSTDLGTFTGSTIADSSSIKAALQALETAVEAASGTTDFADNLFRISDDGDSTKKIAFQASGISASTVRTITMPDANVNLADVNNAILTDGSRAMAANLSMTNNKITNLANGTASSDAVNKGQLDAAIAGLDFQADVDDYVADATTTAPGAGLPAAATGQRYILASNTGSLHANWGTITGVGDNDIVEYDGSDWVVSYDVSVQGEGAIAWNQADNYFMLWSGSAWSEFGGLSGVTAGAGLDKTGNTLFVELDTDAGLEFDTPGDAGKLRAKVDGSTIERHSGGLRVKASGITSNEIANNAVDENKLNSSVAGNGLTGGGGSALAVGAGNGIQVNSDSVEVLHSPLIKRSLTAGESFAANTSFLVRWAVNGETAGRVYKADKDASAADNFYVFGIALSTGAVSAGQAINVIMLGTHTLGSGDSNFNATDIGKPVFLGASGAFTLTAPSAADEAVVRVGMVQEVDRIWMQPEVVGVN